MFKRALRFMSGSFFSWALPLVGMVPVLAILGYKLGSLNYFSPAEAEQPVAGLASIKNSPVNLLHQLIRYATSLVMPESHTSMRLPSLIIGLLFAAAFYILLRQWFGKFISFAASILMAATPWFVLLSRNAAADIMYFFPVIVLLAANWYFRSSNKSWAYVLFAAATGIGLYVPGMVYLYFLSALFCWRLLAKSWEQTSPQYKAIGSALFILLLLPLIVWLIAKPEGIKSLLLIPVSLPGLIDFFKACAWNTASLFWRLPVHIDISIDRLPMLNILQSALALFGAIALYRRTRKVLVYLLFVVLLGIILAAFASDPHLLLLSFLPLSILSAAGLRYLFVEWQTVFPRNPLPRYLALSLIMLVVAMHFVYGFKYVIAAWPNTAETKEIYVIK